MRVHDEVSLEEVRKMIKNKFLGEITQMPPIKSRVKRQYRQREIKKFELFEKDDKNILFEVECQGGTYIRKLCLHPDTEILTKKGLIKIKNFHDDPQNIYSLDKKEIKIKKPIALQKITSPKKLIELKMSSGIKILATFDHKMLISTKKGYEMLECENIKKGDYLTKTQFPPIITKEYTISDMLDDNYYIEQKEIKELCKEAMIKKFGSIRKMNRKTNLDRKVFLTKSKNSISIKHLKIAGMYNKLKNDLFRFKTPKGKIIKINKLTSDHFYLLGLIASDGNNTKEKNTIRYTRIKFHNKDEALINKFLEIYKRLFPTINISKKKIRPDLFELDSSNSLFASIAYNLGIVSPNINSDILPILYCKNDFIKAFLKGYFDGDGTAHFKKKANSTTTYSNIRFFSTNYTNIKRIHQMLLKLKINNRIFENSEKMYVVDISDIISKKKFIKDIGSNHLEKLNKLKKIDKIKSNFQEGERTYIGFHYKEAIRKNKSKLYKIGGNLSRILKKDIPITKGFYKRASKLVNLPPTDNLMIEKVEGIKVIESSEKNVFDMTIPETHNFLIETGYVSSNCHDLGEELEVGAHMLELRRMRAGIFKEDDENYPVVNLYDFEKAVEEYKKGNDELLRDIIIPAEIVGNVYPVVEINNGNLKNIFTGKPIYKKDLKGATKVKKDADIVVFCEERFIGMYKVIRNKDLFAKAKFVLQPLEDKK